MTIDQVKRITAVLERNEGDIIQLTLSTEMLGTYIEKLQLLQRKNRDSILDIIAEEK